MEERDRDQDQNQDQEEMLCSSRVCLRNENSSELRVEMKTFMLGDAEQQCCGQASDYVVATSEDLVKSGSCCR